MKFLCDVLKMKLDFVCLPVAVAIPRELFRPLIGPQGGRVQLALRLLSHVRVVGVAAGVLLVGVATAGRCADRRFPLCAAASR